MGENRMVIPRFVATQTDEEVTIFIHAPDVDLSELEIYMDRTSISFNCTPYYLWLKLPGEIKKDDLRPSVYDYPKSNIKVMGKLLGESVADININFAASSQKGIPKSTFSASSEELEELMVLCELFLHRIFGSSTFQPL